MRERIRINGKPLSEDVFAKYFWDVWDRFEDGNGEPLRTDLPIRPAYFRYLTYMAYHAFLRERVDATIFEVGVGGLLDPTNLIPSPIVTGVTSLGLDHVNILGHSILEIAGHKGGIYKPGVPALTVEQFYPETLNVLRTRALELKSSSFTIVPKRSDLEDLEIGLAGSHQKLNATFAIALVNTFLASPRLPPNFLNHANQLRDETASRTGSVDLPPLPSDPSNKIPNKSLTDSSSHHLPKLPQEIVFPPLSDRLMTSIINTRWPGRCQTIVDPVRKGVTWFLDGAHTVESISLCGNWWRQKMNSIIPSMDTGSNHRKILIFNCTFGRNALGLLSSLVDSVSSHDQATDRLFDQVIITSNTTYIDGKFKSDLRSVAQDTQPEPDQRVQNEIQGAWLSIPNSTKNVLITNSVEQAVEEVMRPISQSDDLTSVLVTGSLHLIGGLIEVAGLQQEL